MLLLHKLLCSPCRENGFLSKAFLRKAICSIHCCVHLLVFSQSLDAKVHPLTIFSCSFSKSLMFEPNDIYPILAIMRFPIITLFTHRSYIVNLFFHDGYSLTADQIFSHIFCNCMASQFYDSPDEAQILHSP